MRRKLWMGLIAIALIGGLTSGLIAAFSGEETSSGDGLTASGQDLVVNDENPWVSKVFEVENILPGDSGAATIKLENIGGEGRLYLQLKNLVDEPGIAYENEPIPDNGELSPKLDTLLWRDDGDGQYEAGEEIIATGTLHDIVATTYDLGVLPNGGLMYLGISWSVDKAVGNEIMGDKSIFDIEFRIE